MGQQPTEKVYATALPALYLQWTCFPSNSGPPYKAPEVALTAVATTN